jgi:hypothetical protein
MLLTTVNAGMRDTRATDVTECIMLDQPHSLTLLIGRLLSIIPIEYTRADIATAVSDGSIGSPYT